MSAGRPASLDGSLLARKGDASPAIPDESPLVLDFEEHRAADGDAAKPTVAPPQLVAGPPANTLTREPPRPFAVPRFMPSFIRARWAAVGVALAVAAAVAAAVALLVILRSPEGGGAGAAGAQTGAVDDVARADATAPPQDRRAAPPEPAGATVSLPVAAGADIDKLVPKQASDPKSGSVAAAGAPTPAAPTVSTPVNVPAEEPARPGDVPSEAPNIPSGLPKTVAPVPVPKEKPALAAGDYGVQLASIPIEARAKQEAFRLQKLLGPVLGEREISVERAVVAGKGTMYRLRANGYASNTEARAACARVAEFNVGCLAFRR